jgi:hypothetical protein
MDEFCDVEFLLFLAASNEQREKETIIKRRKMAVDTCFMVPSDSLYLPEHSFFSCVPGSIFISFYSKNGLSNHWILCIYQSVTILWKTPIISTFVCYWEAELCFLLSSP